MGGNGSVDNEKRFHLELTLDPEQVKDQLKAGVGPDDEVFNYIFALMSKRDSKLRETDLSRRPSFFFRTYFMDNLLANGFDNDIRYKYVENVWYWSQEQDLFCHKNIFVPIHIVDTHYILAVIFILERRI